SALGLVCVSAGFAYYLSNFGHYGATYGSLGAVIGMMLWIYLSTYVVLLGAEVNAEIERQTARDTTVDPKEPRGSRDAAVADNLGNSQAP
ncbi:MAG: YhjD/YihY/BrkB family envelope integrity protein, partial [Roseibium sp.]